MLMRQAPIASISFGWIGSGTPFARLSSSETVYRRPCRAQGRANAPFASGGKHRLESFLVGQTNDGSTFNTEPSSLSCEGPLLADTCLSRRCPKERFGGAVRGWHCNGKSSAFAGHRPLLPVASHQRPRPDLSRRASPDRSVCGKNTHRIFLL
jgi:hypothetical protein